MKEQLKMSTNNIHRLLHFLRYNMLQKAKAVKANNTTPNEFDKAIIELMNKHMTRKNKIKDSNSVECTEKILVTNDSEREEDKCDEEVSAN